MITITPPVVLLELMPISSPGKGGGLSMESMEQPNLTENKIIKQSPTKTNELNHLNYDLRVEGYSFEGLLRLLMKVTRPITILTTTSTIIISTWNVLTI